MRWGWMVLLMAGVGLLITGCGADAQREAQLKAAEAAAKREAAAARNNSNAGQTAGEKAEQPAPPKPADAEKKDDKPAAGDKAVAGGEELKLEGGKSVRPPAEWKKGEPVSRMRAAQYAIAKVGDDKDDAELAIFDKLGGGLEANLKRWAGQMGGPDSQKAKKTVKTAGGDEATIAEYEGSYAAMNPQTGAPGEAQEGYKMLAAYVISGGKEYQFKLTGPAATVNAAKPGFEKMIESFK